jgi:IGR protein motif
MPSENFRTLGVEPTRSRRYLLSWRERYRQGRWGPGGDFTEVSEDGAAYLKVMEVAREAGETSPATALQGENMTRIVANVKAGVGAEEAVDEPIPVKFYEIGEETLKIKGPGALPVKGSEGQMAKVEQMDRLWEIKRGVKKDGGERRIKEVRAKRAAEERKKARETARSA